MSVTHALLLPLHSSPSLTARPTFPVSARPALTDSTNVHSRLNICGPGYPKSLVYPTSSTRTGCGWNDLESSSGSISPSCHARHHSLSPTLPLFPVAYKAPPTVSISLSAACSQNIPGERFCDSGVEGVEPDLPDVRSVVPFPSTPLDDDVDVDMFDGTCGPCHNNHFPSAGQAPRKRRSAHSSVSSPQSIISKDTRPKRPRRSRRQVAELWWLGVVHRSILHGIEVRQSTGERDVPDRQPPGVHDLEAMDRELVERIQKRLDDNGCVDGRTLPNLLPRISSPSISVPSLNLLAPSGKTSPVDSLTLSSGLNPHESSSLDRTATSSPATRPTFSASSSIPLHSPTPSSRHTSRRRHVHFDLPRSPSLARPRSNIPRRSPSPPARTGTVFPGAQSPPLTIPQLVASLMLAYRDRDRPRLRGRTPKAGECEDNAGRSPPSVPCQAARCSEGDAMQHEERLHRSSVALRTRLLSAPGRKSPLSRVAYTES